MNEQVQTLRQLGYVIVPDLIPTSTLDEIWYDIVRVFQQAAAESGLEYPDSMERTIVSKLITDIFVKDRDAYFTSAKLSQHLVSLHRLSTSPVLIDLLKAAGIALPAMSTRQVLHFVSAGLRVPDGYDKTPPHQDWRSVQSSLNGLTIWIPLWSIKKGQNALEIAPKSHLAGLLPSEDHPFGHKVVDDCAAKFEFEEISIERGSVVILSNFTMHRTSEIGQEVVRIAASFRYNDAAEKTFVERFYPNPYIYKPDMKLITSDFPSVDQIKKAMSVES